MRFSHTADCHIGGHRNPKLRRLTEEAFKEFIDGTIAADTDFALIAGDLFNTAIPGIDALKFTVEQLQRLKKRDIPVYAIPGSHDYSPSGKTMLDVLEKAGLISNVWKGDVVDGKLKLEFTTDKKTGAKITGILGKRGMLDKELYKELDPSIEKEPGDKIFLFHTALTELKPKGTEQMASQPVSLLPKGFLYYAGGHVHIVKRYQKDGYEKIVYPGPLFPNSFSELEELEHGGYFLYADGQLTRKDIKLREVLPITFSVDGLAGVGAGDKLKQQIGDLKVNEKIILLRLTGKLSEGSINDLGLRELVKDLENRGAYCVLRNTAQLMTEEFIGERLEQEEAHDIEAAMLEKHKEQLTLEGIDGQELAKRLLTLLSREQKEGEKLYEYKETVAGEAMKLIDKMHGT